LLASSAPTTNVLTPLLNLESVLNKWSKNFYERPHGPFPWGIRAPTNTRCLVPTGVHTTSRILIGSAVVAQFTVMSHLPTLSKRDGSVSLGMLRVRTLNRITVGLSGHRSDRPVIAGDLVDVLVPAG